jgi:glutathione S-transferase
MKLYYSPGACSLAPHIVWREAGLDVTLVKVDLKGKRTDAGDDYRDLVPMGYVPAVELDDGRILTEVAVVVQFLADQKPDLPLIPKAGTFERYRVQEWLNFVATELHKTFSPLWHRPTDELRAAVTEKLTPRFEHVGRKLGSNQHLFGDDFTVADAYLYAILRWSRPTKVALPPKLQDFVERVADRPAVLAAREAEGIKL